MEATLFNRVKLKPEQQSFSKEHNKLLGNFCQKQTDNQFSPKKILHKTNVLLVEDTPIILKINLYLLQQLNCQVDTAICAEEALVKLQHQQYDLIFLDIGLPDISGIELAKRIRSHSSNIDIPIIALTALALDEVKKECFAAGMNAFLTKPVESLTLQQTMNRLLGI